MKWKSTVVLLVVAIAFGLYLFLVEQKRTGTDDAKTMAKKVLDIRASQIKTIKVEREDGLLEARKNTEKTGEESSVSHWQLTAPVAARADDARFEKITTDLERLERALGKDITGKKLSDYGLEKPKVTLTFTHAGDQTVAIHLGEMDPLGQNVYIRLGESADVIVVSKSLLDDLSAPLADYRNRSLMELARYDVAEIRIVKSGKPVALKRGQTGWRVVEPIAARANPAKIESVIARLYESQVEAFLKDEPGDLEKYGLRMPGLVIEFASDDGRVSKLSFGKPVADDPVNVYARRGAEGYLVTVSGKLVDQVGLALADLRDRRVLAIADRNIQSLEVTGARDYALGSESGQWRLTRPASALAEGDAVTRLLRQLIDMNAEDFPNDDPKDLAPYGLDKPALTVTLTDRMDKKAVLQFGKQIAGTDLCNVREEGEKPVYAVTMEYFDAVNQDPLAFRNRRILSGEGREATRLAVDREGLSAELVKNESGWQMIQPVRARADNFHAKEIGRLAGNLSAVRLVQENPKDLGAYGLDKPYLRARITTQSAAGGQEETTEILLGGESPEGGRFASVAGQNLVFVAPAAVVGTLEYELRARSIFSAGMDRIVGLAFNDLKIDKVEDRWMVTAPVQGEADPYVLNLTLDELADMKAVRFARYKADSAQLAQFGLDKPAYRVKVELTVGKPVEILIGAKVADEGYYAKLGDDPFVAVISPTSANRLMLDASKLVVHRVLPSGESPKKRASTAPATAPAK